MGMPPEIETMLQSFEKFYREQHNTTKLNWLHDWSGCTIIYEHNGTKFTLTARPCHYFILNLFQEKDLSIVSEVRESTGIEFLELERYLWSLQRAGILLLGTNDKPAQQIEMNTEVRLNTEFTSKKHHIDLWKKFRESKPVQRSAVKKLRGATDISAVKKLADQDAPTVDSDDENSSASGKRVEDDRRIFLQAALVRVIKK